MVFKSIGNWFSKTGIELLKSKIVLYLLVLIIIFNLYNYAMIGHEAYAVCLLLIGFLTSFFSKNMIVILFTALAVTNIIRYGVEQYYMEGFVGGGLEIDELTEHLTSDTNDVTKEQVNEKMNEFNEIEKEKVEIENNVKKMNLENQELNTNPNERDKTIDTLVKTITASNSIQMLERNMNFGQLELGKDKVNLALKYIDRVANEKQRSEVKAVLEIQLKLIDQLMSISPLVNEFKDALKNVHT